MIPVRSHSDRDTQEFRKRSGARETYWINELNKYIKEQGLWDNYVLYPMMGRTNAPSGNIVFGTGGLTSNEMELFNNPTRTNNGIVFESASSQYGTIADFLGSETLTVLCRTSLNSTTSSTFKGIVGQWDGTLDQRSWLITSGNSNDIRLSKSASGSSVSSVYTDSGNGASTSDVSYVANFEDSASTKLWINKSEVALTLDSGSVSSRHNGTGAISISGYNTGTSTVEFLNATYHALAFVTGTLTTEQRETITDLINLIGSPPPKEDLLWKYSGASAAYSLRPLYPTFKGINAKPVVRVRESGTDTEQDFTAEEITDGTLTAFAGANDGFVVTWYDQSGNGRDATQSTASVQPQIVDAGSLITENGLPIVNGLRTDAVFGSLSHSGSTSSYTGADACFYVGDRQNAISGRGLFTINGANIQNGGFVNQNSGFGWNTDIASYVPTNGAIYLWSGESTSASSKTYENGVLKVTDETPLNSGINDIIIFRTGTRANPSRAYEIVYYNSDQSANRSGIESNIASHYGITLS